MDAAWIGRTLVPLAVGGGLALMRKYLPAKVTEKEHPVSAAEYDSFSRINWIVNIALLAVCIVFAFVSYKILVLANQRFAAAEGAARFQLLPEKVIWGFSLVLVRFVFVGKLRSAYGLFSSDGKECADMKFGAIKKTILTAQK